MDLTEERYRISELAEKAGVSKRTIHYYISKGLIPPAEGAGVASTYGEEHLAKVRLIKKMQDMYLPLEKIRHIVPTLTYKECLEKLKKAVQETSDPTDGLLTANTYMDEAITAGTLHYERMDLGLGIELHYPSSIGSENPELIRNIEKYARKLIEER